MSHGPHVLSPLLAVQQGQGPSYPEQRLSVPLCLFWGCQLCCLQLLPWGFCLLPFVAVSNPSDLGAGSTFPCSLSLPVCARQKAAATSLPGPSPRTPLGKLHWAKEISAK